ncbi:hypothetical protein C9374_007396 [Naegleria lovaniensis]|uniref:Uncharacterized protein n=1 Tax=Naegleria lovaniensis TaxID=51637 RepID=A0AA88KGJ6_NAELO|nr:uncharacterized protein C9374_007396 [Naegleria lovaniensis]KAG2379257.1 hypothetical protein C9374_007396 [Naegleria lovaniensis]
MSEPLHQQQDSSAVLYHASISKESLQSKLDDRSSSTSSDSKKTKSSSKSTGFTSRLSEQYSTTLISLLFKKPIPQWLLWLFHVYIIYGSLSVPFERACDDKSNMLRRFPLTQCWSQTNIVYMVIAIIFIMVQIPLSVIGLFILFSSAGTFPKHPTIISMDSFFFIALLSVVNQVYLFISQFIPPDGVLARPILNVVLSLVPLSFLLYERPFTFTRMNSLYSGILFAKWGGSVAAIVAITVNKSNSLDLGLSFLLGIGLGSVLLLFGIGFGVAELIHFFMKTRARHARAQFDESHGSGKHIFNDNLLRLCFKSNLFSDEIDEEMLKYANSRKSIMSTNALIASAVYTHRFHDNPQLTLATLKYALRHSNFIQKLVIRAMIQDIELYYGLQTTSEVRSLLEKTSLLQEKLLQIRKLFWQYFVANEDDYDKISDLVYSMYSIEKSIVMIFSHLLANYPENQNILKRRNVFMQEFLFEISSPLTEQTTGRSSTDLYDEEKQKTRKAIQDLKLQKRRSTSLLFTENVYREAINSKVDTKKTSCYFLTAELVSILLILVVLLLGVFTTLEGNHVQFLKQSCDLIPVPFRC